MKIATRDLVPRSYDAAQTASSVKYIASVDRTPLRDGTYFVIEVDRRWPAAAGAGAASCTTGSGDAADDARIIDPASEPARVRAMSVHPDWTRRGLGTRILEACHAAAKAEGFTSLALMPTLPGVPL